MSATHKAALAEGREQGRAVRRYLEALEAHRPKRGRKRTPESVQKRLSALEIQMASADPLSRLHLAQERMDLERELAGFDQGAELDQLEKEFLSSASPYGQRKGITYAAWRAAGVDPSVLRKAGIRRGSSAG